MNNKKLAALTSILLGLVLGALVLTTALTPVQAQPDDAYITIVKGPDQAILSGATANFEITVTSTYTGSLTGVTVSDPLALDCERNIGVLAAGASVNYSCSRAGVMGDFTNIATVSGEIPGTVPIPVGDSDEAIVDVIAPAIAIAKTPDSQVVASGDPANFTIYITNTGDSTLTNVTVSDPLSPGCDNDTIGDLGSGASTSYACQSGATTDDFTNVATVAGTSLAGTDVTDEDTAFVDVIHPALAIDKTSDLQTVTSGSTVQFTVTVTNVGDVTLTDVTLTDDEAPLCNATVGSLAPSEGFNSNCNVVVMDDLLNTAVVTGTPPVGSDVSASDAVYVDLITPFIGIDKRPDDLQWLDSGEDASFQVFITNHGDVSLTDVTISDPMAPGCNLGPVDLDPDESTSTNCSVEAVTDSFINIATVSATSLAGEITNADASRVILNDRQSCPGDMGAYWKLDETSGTIFDDFFGGHDAECEGVCPSPAAGQVAGAQVFNSDNTGLSVSSLPRSLAAFDWGADDSFSIEFWMRTNQPGSCSGGSQVVVGRDDGTLNGMHWWVGCRASGEAIFVLRDRNGNGAGLSLYGITDLEEDDVWHHVVAVRNAHEETTHLYVDGVEEDSREGVTYPGGFSSAMVPLNIGWLNLNGGFHFAGTMDELALYDRALPATEVQQHYYEGLLTDRTYCDSDTFAPMIFSDPVTEVSVQRPYAYDVESIGAPTPTYTLTVTPPEGLTIDPLTGLISWMPVVTQQGSHSIEIEASNSVGTDTQAFILEVLQGPLCLDDMISYWKLDEDDPSGTIFADFYNSNDASCIAGQCPAPTSDGQVGGAQVFDVSDEVNVPDDSVFDWGAYDSFSIEFWMRTDQPGSCSGTSQVVVGRDDGASDLHWWVGCRASGEAVFVLIDRDGNGAGLSLYGTTNLEEDDEWHHVVALRDVDEGTTHLYVDGVEEASRAGMTYPGGFEASTALNIGWLNLVSGYHFSGTIDEVALYNKALNSTEIEQHYDRGLEGNGYCITPEIALDKTAEPRTIYAGDSVIYSYVVTNPGDDPLSNVDVSDDLCSPLSYVGGDVGNDEILGIDETWIYRCSMSLDEDTINTATVEGTPSLGQVVSATDTALVNVINPNITLIKQASSTTIYTGEEITYTYSVFNAGDDPLWNVNLEDDQCSPVSYVGGDEDLNEELDPGEIWSYVCSKTLSDDVTSNTTLVTALDSLGGVVEDTDSVLVNVINPGIDLGKHADQTFIYPGQTVVYTYTVANTQDTPLLSVDVSDDQCAPVVLTQGDDQLDPDETWTYVCSDTLSVDTTNVATAMGTDSLGGTVSDTSTVFVDVINPDITVYNQPHQATVYDGDMVTYTYAVVNSGDALLSSVSVNDDLCSPVSLVGGDGNQNNRLDPDETWTYTCSMVLFEDTSNTVTATSFDALGNIVSDTDTAFVNVIHPNITIDKQADPSSIYPGETVTFTYAVISTQDDPLFEVGVSDDQCNPVNFAGGDSDTDDELDPGETWNYVCSMVLYTDTTNTAIVTGTTSLSGIVSDTDTAFVNVINPDIALDKQAHPAIVNAGDWVTYTYDVLNPGDDPLSNVTLSDDMCSPVTLVGGDGDLDSELDPQETWAYICSMILYTNTINRAIVTGTDSLGAVVSDTDTVFVLVDGEAGHKLYLPLVLNRD